MTVENSIVYWTVPDDLLSQLRNTQSTVTKGSFFGYAVTKDGTSVVSEFTPDDFPALKRDGRVKKVTLSAADFPVDDTHSL